MNYKLDNPVALKVINCMIIDRPMPVKKLLSVQNTAIMTCSKHCYFVCGIR